MKFWKNGNSLFYIPKSDDQNEIIHCLPTIDEIINSGNMIKQSRNRISIFLMNGKTYFGKAPRIYQYVWYKQIRYFFTPPRSLWSACVAQKIHEAQ